MTTQTLQYIKSVKLIATAAILMTLTATLHAEVVISEFMAKNDSTLVDGNGDYSDWIELCNLGESTVDLTGWYLSDDSDDLTQWTFPSTTLAAGEYLVIFASGEDEPGYTDALGYLHANFKLSGDGEDVVLTQSDGTTIEYAFYDYPVQSDDVSYGLAQESDYSYLVVEEQDATAFVGTSEPASTWNTAGFDDSSWTSGETGVGYDKDTTYASLINLDLESAMMNEATRPPTFYNSAYIRVEFNLSDATDISQLALRMKYDDGFVAYINGTQVASANAPTSLSYSSAATAEHDGTEYEDFTLLNADSYLQSGDNVLAIHALAAAFDPQSSNGEPDFFIMPVLSAISVSSTATNSAMYLTSSTPGADNIAGISGYVEDTKFSVDRGFFTASTNVAITCETEGASIYYTTDATEPSANNGTLYTGPITISKTTVLRAVATKSGYQPSDVDTQSYFFLSDIIAQGTTVSDLDPEFPASAVNGQDFDYGMDTAITQSDDYSGEIEGALKAIPSISIVTDPDNLFSASSGIYVNASEQNDEDAGEDWERETSIELINPDGSDGFQINGGLRIRGASSTTSENPKHSFRFFFRSEYGTSRLEYPLFGDDGADSFKRMDLRTGQNFSWAYQNPEYATWLYDIFNRDTHHDMNQPYTRGEYYHLYINGMYWGLYQTEERCDSRYAESYYGGDKDDFDAVKADADSGIIYAVDGTRDAYDSLWTAASSGFTANSAYFKAQGMNTDGTENSSYTKLLDPDNVIDYMLLVYFTANRDSPIGPPTFATMPRNLTAIYNRTNPDGFKFVAHDNEHSLEIQEGVNHNRFSQTLSSSFDNVDFFTPWWLHLKLMENEEYALKFADHVHKHFFNNGALTTSETYNRLNTRKNEIYSAVVAESARWGDSGSSSSGGGGGGGFPPGGGGTTTTTTRTRDDDWLVQANWLLDTYMTQRSSIVYNQIVAKGWYPTVAAPEFNQHGGSIASGFSLSITGTSQIYYTTDGTDPRAVGGGVAGTAYNSALNLTQSTLVKARTLSSGTWSALTEAEFIVEELSPLRVTEIMYHPAAAGDGDEAAYDSEDFEFIELLNTGSSTIGLTGTEFTEGIVFDFSEGDVLSLDPGEYVVLVSDIDAFSARYTNAANINIAGEYHGQFFIAEGSLDNAGEEIVLKDALGNTIQSFEYSDSWYDITDGEGYSLTLLDPTASTNTWNDSSSWRASAYNGGTPGYGLYEDFPLPGDLLINEMLTHQDTDDPGDWVEIYNNSASSVDLNGWFISDDADNLAKVELSGLSIIQPGGYLVLTEADHFGDTVAGTNAFALSELGETVYLSSGESGELTGYRVEQEFGVAAKNISFGRYVKSDGTVDFTAQSTQSPGADNAYPLIGSVIVSEVMYHPADSESFEYIELCNITSDSISLYDPNYPANTWKIEGAISYTFPTATVLGTGESIIVTETTPAEFITKYSVPDGTTILGPYDGKLNNSGEDIRLTRPGAPEESTDEIPYILVELVEYSDDTPWPAAADGGGSTLERITATAYPNESTNWVAAVASPGSTGFTVISADSDEDGMPDEWELYYFESVSAENGGAEEDWDDDGTTNYNEWYAGTDPTDSDSVFKIVTLSTDADSVLTWWSVEGKTYSIWSTTNLLTVPFTPLTENISATPPQNTSTVTVDSAKSTFFKIRVDE